NLCRPDRRRKVADRGSSHRVQNNYRGRARKPVSSQRELPLAGMKIQAKWSGWATLSIRHPLFTPQTLRELLDGGQAFRWNQVEESCWQCIWEENLFRLLLGESGKIQYSYYCPQADAESTLRDYLQLEAEVELRIDSLPWRSDAHQQRAMSAFPGLRILKQPPGETLLSFLLSSNKQIPQIKQ